MAIYEITAGRIRAIEVTTFNAAGVRERGDLQRLLRTQIDVVAPDTLVIAEEFGDWQDSRRRIDLLALDREANLVVIELKRTEDGGHMDLQAIRYAAMVSTMTFEKVVDEYAKHLRQLGSEVDARNAILEFLDWDQPDEERFAQGVRIVLASAEFSRELTTAVMWLNENGLDIRCVRIKPYSDGERVLIDVQQVIPLPEAADYIVKIKEKEVRERTARREQSPRRDMYLRFWTGLKQHAATKTDMHRTVTPRHSDRFSGRHGGPGMNFSYGASNDRLRVGLYIFGTDAMSAKAIFDQLHADRVEIERTFGAALGWERLEEKGASRISCAMDHLDFADEATWPSSQDAMIDTMIRFERALRPAIVKLGL